MTETIDYVDKKATIANDHIELCNTPDSTQRNQLLCHHCGQAYTFNYPLPITEFTDLMKFFTKHHKKCLKKNHL